MAFPQLKLNTIPLQFNVFSGNQYEYKGPDLSILERGGAKREARRGNALQGISGIDTALSGIEQQLNPAEGNWFYDYKNNLKEKMRNFFNEGNYGQVIINSGLLGGDVATDSAILSRIDANKKYNEWDNTLKQRLAKGEISQDTYKYAIANNPYQFSETTDAYGNVTGGQLVDPKQVYDTINWGDVSAKAAAFNRPDVTTYEGGGGGTNPALYNTKDATMNKLNGMLGAASSSWKTGHQIEQVKSEEIINTIGAMLNMPDLLNQAVQDWEVSVWNYNQLGEGDKKSLVEQGLIRNGVPVTLSEYLDNKSKLFADALAYKKEGNTDIRENSFGFTNKSGTDVDGMNNPEYSKPNYQQTDERGPMVETSTSAATKDVDRSRNNTNGRFKKHK